MIKGNTKFFHYMLHHPKERLSLIQVNSTPPYDTKSKLAYLKQL